jgi:aspartate/glutamate racemase
LRTGGISLRSTRKALEMTFAANDAGASGVLVTCSTLVFSVDLLRSLLRVPVPRTDEPAFEEMLNLGDRHVGLLAASNAALNSVEPLDWRRG